jgi:hypothetical protein
MKEFAGIELMIQMMTKLIESLVLMMKKLKNS